MVITVGAVVRAAVGAEGESRSMNKADDGGPLGIERDFVDTLERSPLMLEDSSRELIIANLGRVFGKALGVRKQTTARLNVIELVRVCAGLPHGLELLTDQITFLEPLSPEVPELLHLCDAWQAVYALDELWAELHAELHALRLAGGDDTDELVMLRELVGIATEARVVELPKHCSTLWRLFVYLVGANTDPNGLPPCMILLRCVENRTGDSGLARRLHGWNRELAKKWQLVDLLDAARGPTVPTTPHRLSLYLIIQIEHDAVDNTKLLLSHWKQWDPSVWRPQRGDNRMISSAALEAEVDDIIADMETTLGASTDAARMPDIRLEFVLPAELLNYPVHQMRKTALADETVYLALDHPVVVRSLERLRMTRLHLAWHRRWDRLATAQPITHRRHEPGDAHHLSRLHAELAEDQRIFAVVLSGPPVPGNNVAVQEIGAALRAGIPAIMWHRVDCSMSAFHDAVETMVNDGALVHLPDRVAALRRAALRGGDQSSDYPHWEIALLWDDPTRFPDPLREIGR